MSVISLQVPKHCTRRATSTLGTDLLYLCILKHVKCELDIVRVNTHLRNVRDIWYDVDEAMMPVC